MFPLRLFVFLFSSDISCLVFAMSRVHLTQDGGYKGIVVKIDKDVDMDGCQEIIENVKVRNGLKEILIFSNCMLTTIRSFKALCNWRFLCSSIRLLIHPSFFRNYSLFICFKFNLFLATSFCIILSLFACCS